MFCSIQEKSTLYQLAQLRLGEGKVPDVKVLQDVVLEIKKTMSATCQQKREQLQLQ